MRSDFGLNEEGERARLFPWGKSGSRYENPSRNGTERNAACLAFIILRSLPFHRRAIQPSPFFCSRLLEECESVPALTRASFMPKSLPPQAFLLEERKFENFLNSLSYFASSVLLSRKPCAIRLQLSVLHAIHSVMHCL